MKKSQKIKNQARIRRHKRVKAKIFGTAKYPRLSIYRSLNHIYAQLIDDQSGQTIASVSDLEVKKGQTRIEKATMIGQLIAQKAINKKITKAVFDRGRFKYHGRVKALAESARKAGLKF